MIPPDGGMFKRTQNAELCEENQEEKDRLKARGPQKDSDSLNNVNILRNKPARTNQSGCSEATRAERSDRKRTKISDHKTKHKRNIKPPDMRYKV